MNSFINFICAVTFVLMLTLPASGTNMLNPAELSPVQRTDIGEDIAHYTYEITVDTGPYGKIRLHRFIRETAPYQPIQSAKGLLLLTGSSATVMGIYATSLTSEHAAWDHSILIYLAKNNIDVWGMDYAWSLVPAERKDFHFMKDWTIVTDARHSETALSVVRTIRGYTGQGAGKLTLLGHSWGETVGFSVLSEESQKPDDQRNVGAFIPVDCALKYSVSDSARRAQDCADADGYQAMWDSGTYADDVGSFLAFAGRLAESDPEGPSEIIPGVTNYQALLYMADDPQWSWHLFGVDFDKDYFPTGLRFTDSQFAIDLFQGFAPHWPVKAAWEDMAFRCDEGNVPGFDHIDQISVPILYVGAAGGWGESGYYTLTLTGSEDITKFTVQLLPDKKRGFDFGHGDLFTAKDAENLVWKPILDWVMTH